MSQAALKLSDYLPELPTVGPSLLLADNLAPDDRQIVALLSEARASVESKKKIRQDVEFGFDRLFVAIEALEPLDRRVREMRENLPDLLSISAFWHNMLKEDIGEALLWLKLSRKIVNTARRHNDLRRALQFKECHRLLQHRLSESRGLAASLKQIVRRYRDLLEKSAVILPAPESLLPRDVPLMEKVALRRSIMNQIPKARAYLAK